MFPASRIEKRKSLQPHIVVRQAEVDIYITMQRPPRCLGRAHFPELHSYTVATLPYHTRWLQVLATAPLCTPWGKELEALMVKTGVVHPEQMQPLWQALSLHCL